MKKKESAAGGAKGLSDFTLIVEKIVSSIPKGRVCTYGGIAAAAGSPLGARQVVRTLHARSEISRLPWQRVVAKGATATKGRIALEGHGRDEQIALLRAEGVSVEDDGSIDLERYGWRPRLTGAPPPSRQGSSSTGRG